MRDDKERLRDINEAIEKIGKYVLLAIRPMPKTNERKSG